MFALAKAYWYKEPQSFEEPAAMPKSINLTLEDVKEFLHYDAETGKLTWIKAPSRRISAGSEAGAYEGFKLKPYRYIGIKGIQTPAARIAWILHYGEWPKSNVLFKDGNSHNLKADNLKLADFPSIVEVDGDGRRTYKMPKEQQRHYGLKRYYGMTGEEYGAKMAEQKGLCAICAKPETAMFNGAPKVMHVDHDHETGAIRDLLCGSCNAMLGHAKDSPATLRAAADYIERHAAKVVNLDSRRSAQNDGAAS